MCHYFSVFRKTKTNFMLCPTERCLILECRCSRCDILWWYMMSFVIHMMWYVIHFVIYDVFCDMIYVLGFFQAKEFPKELMVNTYSNAVLMDALINNKAEYVFIAGVIHDLFYDLMHFMICLSVLWSNLICLCYSSATIGQETKWECFALIFYIITFGGCYLHQIYDAVYHVMMVLWCVLWCLYVFCDFMMWFVMCFMIWI